MNRKTMAIPIMVMAGLLVWAVSSSGSGSLAQGGGVGPQAVLTPLLQYQGRLTDPGTGEAVADGNYTMTFRLYDVASGGSPLWTETEDVSVQDGLFSTVLGDTTALDQALFNGQALWLGIKVDADAEATPRQQVLPVAYALSLVPGAVVEANSSSAVLQVNNTGSGTALSVEGPTVLDGDLNVSGGLTGGSHNHSGADITSDTVAEARIHSSIARDSEVTSAINAHTGDADAHHVRYTDAEAWAAVLDNDGPGSTLDADLLDGTDSSGFADATHRHAPGDIIPQGTGSGLDADLLDGSHASAFASSAHIHDDRYYTEGESDGRFVNATGDTMSGALTVPQVTYTTPRTHYFVVGGEGFVPGSNVDYTNTYGNGGAYIHSGWGALVAPVHLPHGAVVTEFEVFFYDNSSSNLSVDLDLQGFGGGYATMATISSSGTPGYSSAVDTTISSATIYNTSYSYLVYAYCSAWDGNNLRIKGALITYTISEAP